MSSRSIALPRRIGSAFLDLVLPPRCPGCRTIVPADGSFCAPCWSDLAFITDPQCARCGHPFAFDGGIDTLCGDCIETPPDYDRGRAVLAYNDRAAGLVLGLKHGDKAHLARIMGRMMARAAAEALAAGALLVPVPLHPRRLRRRFYNQSALLAQALAAATSAEVLPDALLRRRDTPPSQGMSRQQRLKNVAGAIVVNPRRAARIAGRRILLVDDVLTTGATVNACARALRRAGSPFVDIVTFARVTHHVPESA